MKQIFSKLSGIIFTVFMAMCLLPVQAHAEENQVISSVSVTLDAPAVGALPDCTAEYPEGAPYHTIHYSDDDGYYRNGVAWRIHVQDGTEPINPDSHTFQDSTRYTVIMYLTAEEGYEFSAGTTAVVNGKTAAARQEGSTLEVSYTFEIQEKPVSYPVWVGGVQVNSNNKDDILGDGKASFDPDGNILTLNNATITGVYKNSNIYTLGIDLTVNGSAVISGGSNVIYTEAEVSKGGSLTVNGNFDLHGEAIGIIADHDVTFTGGTVTVQSGDKSLLCFGVFADNVSIIDGTVTASNPTGPGIKAMSKFTITGGIADATGGTVSGAISANSGIIIADTHEITLPVGGRISSDNVTILDKDGIRAAHARIEPKKIRHTVTYQVVNGTWSDDTAEDKTETVESGASPASVPTGMKASSGYTRGAWDSDPAKAVITADTTFVYTFEAVPAYTVTYQVVNGTWSDDTAEDKTETVESGASPASVPTGMKASSGYTGGAWDSDPAKAIITADTTFVYTFEAVPAYTVTYKVVNGTWSDDTAEDKTETVESGASPASVPTGMKASSGYTGGAWDSDPAKAVITADTTFVYTFEAVPAYTVTYKVVNGTWSDDTAEDKTETVESGASPASVPTGMKASSGYTGGAWDNDPAKAVITADTTFVYTFEAVPAYTVTYKVVNGTWSDDTAEDKTETVESGASPASVPTGMKASSGYTGGAWDNDPAKAVITADTTFTYTFEKAQPVSYTVAFETNGGSAVADQTVEEGKTASRPADPVKEGYVFAGWYSDTGLTKEFDFSAPVTEDVTVYAKWEKESEPAKITYTIVSGADSTWTKGSGKTVTIKVKRSEEDETCFSHFTGFAIDGTLLAAGDYDAKAGSTVITIKAAALQKLSKGKHTVAIHFDDGDAETTLTVKAAPVPAGGSDPSQNSSNSNIVQVLPRTGDDSHMGLWIALMILSVSGLCGITLITAKQRHAHRS